MRKSHTARAAIGVVALLLSFAVAGCDEDDPSGSPPPSSTPSSPDASSPTTATAAATPTGPVEPTLPTEAERADKAGAAAFVEFYWDAVNYAQATGDTELLKSLAIESCAGCNGGIEAISEIYRRGGRIVGGQQRVTESILTPTPSGGWTASITVHIARQRITGAGDLNQTSNPGTVDLLLAVNHQRGSWFVTYLGD
jgi:hypothetical protein